MSSYSQTFLHGEATVSDRYSRVQEGQRPSPRHHLQPTQRPQVGYIHTYSFLLLLFFFLYFLFFSLSPLVLDQEGIQSTILILSEI